MRQQLFSISFTFIVVNKMCITFIQQTVYYIKYDLQLTLYVIGVFVMRLASKEKVTIKSLNRSLNHCVFAVRSGVVFFSCIIIKKPVCRLEMHVKYIDKW